MTDADRIAALEAKVAQLTEQLDTRVGMAEDVLAIRNLQHIYGYYLDKCLYQEVVDLFPEECEARFHGGIYKGKAGIKRLYLDTFRKHFTGGKNGPVPGFLLDHFQLQDVIHVAPDRKTAQGRFRCFMQAGWHYSTGRGPHQWWEGGMYENIFVREDGIWKFKILDYRAQWHADFATGWALTRPEYVPFASKTYPENPGGPDELNPLPPLWPGTETVPFHYPHPITGESVK